MRQGLFAAFVCTFIGTTAPPALASPLQLQVTGVISTTLGPITAGESFLITVNFDSAAPDLEASPSTGHYMTGAMTFSTGGYSASATNALIYVFPGSSGTPDTFGIFANQFGGLTGAPVNGKSLGSINAVLRDHDGNPFSTDALPTQLDSSGFEETGLFINFCTSYINNGLAGGTCASPSPLDLPGAVSTATIAPAAVPEPATLSLLGLGLAGVAVGHYRRRRR